MRVKPLLPLLALLLAAPAGRADEFTLDDGDRVVMLGSTLVEREQRYGWWELALTTRFVGKKVTFRNLGWSGDTVFGDSHTGFAYTRTHVADVKTGFEHLVEHTKSLKPTVLIVGYGTNESFEGEKGLEKFVKGLNVLLDSLAPTKAKVVLLSPMQQGDVGKPFPDPTKNNKNLRLYADAIAEVAKKRKATFVDLYELLGDPAKQKDATENGIHLTDHGYKWSAEALVKGLGIEKPWQVELDVKAKKVIAAKGAKVEWLDGKGLKVKVTEERLGTARRGLRLKGLPPGASARVKQGNSGIVADEAGWEKGSIVLLDFRTGVKVEATRMDSLRQAIIDKNELYFHRWRPQNETYLHGFRKHEQGKNAIEIPKFDPLIEKKEKEIQEHNQPLSYELEILIEEKK